MESTRRHQPLYKLHGSFGWTNASKDRLLIMGSNKGPDIEGSTVLRKYLERFADILSEPDTRLMVIGYSFSDEHVNQLIINAVMETGLQLFLIDPLGSDLAKPADSLQPSLRTATLADAFERGLIGASRRSLRDIFTTDIIEYGKLQRFFDREDYTFPL